MNDCQVGFSLLWWTYSLVVFLQCIGISETAAIFAGVDVTKEPIPVLPTVMVSHL